MTLLRTLVLLTVVLGIGLSSARAATPETFMPVSGHVDRINKASTAAEALTAYADAVAQLGQDLSIRQAFVGRMIALGQPELAEQQAKDLAYHTRQGLPWAVLAFSEAQRGEVDSAIQSLSRAVREASSDEFVIRTAGEMLAWYDTRIDPTSIQPATYLAAKQIRQRLGEDRKFVAAYDEAHDLLAPVDRPVHPDAAAPGELERVIEARRDLLMASGIQTDTSTPLSVFYTAPAALFPGYAFGYEPWAPRVYSASRYFDRSLGRRYPFPFGAVDPATRFLRLSGMGNSYALVNDDSAEIYDQRPYYYYTPGPLFYNGPGYYGGGGFVRSGFGGGGLRSAGARLQNNMGNGRPSRDPALLGPSPLSDFRVHPTNARQMMTNGRFR